MKTQKTIFNVIALISALTVIAPAMAMGGVEDQAELLKALNSANTVKAVQQVVDPVVTGITPEVVSVVAKPGYGARLLVLAKNTGTAISEYTKSHGGSATYNTVLKNPTTSAAVALATLAGVGLAYRYRSAVGRAVSYANPFSWFGKKSTSAVAPVTESVAPVAKKAPVTTTPVRAVTLAEYQAAQKFVFNRGMNKSDKAQAARCEAIIKLYEQQQKLS